MQYPGYKQTKSVKELTKQILERNIKSPTKAYSPEEKKIVDQLMTVAWGKAKGNENFPLSQVIKNALKNRNPDMAKYALRYAPDAVDFTQELKDYANNPAQNKLSPDAVKMIKHGDMIVVRMQNDALQFVLV